jgi:hypothetical protein
MTVIELDPAAEAFGRDTYTYAVPLEVYSGTQGGHILTFIGAAAEITLGLTHTVGSRITRALSSLCQVLVLTNCPWNRSFLISVMICDAADRFVDCPIDFKHETCWVISIRKSVIA